VCPGVFEKRKLYDGTQSVYGRLEEARILPRNPQISGCLGEKKSSFSCRDSKPDYQVVHLAKTIFNFKSILVTFITSLLNSADYPFRAHF